MIRSMTGFGEAAAEVGGVHYAVELRSLNNKFFKATIRLPEDVAGLEAEIDSWLRQALTRGSAILTLRMSDTTANAAHEINIEALQTYLNRLTQLPSNLGQTGGLELSQLLMLPGVLQPPADFAEHVDKVRPVMQRLVKEACDRLVEMREREGKLLHADLHRHRMSISAKLENIARRAPAVIEEYHARLRQRVQKMLDDAQVKVNEVDLIREVAVYAERSDISEEIARLSGHLEQFREMIDDSDGEPVGRTLDFLAQEMLREANTIASKSNDAQISREIVEIKGGIDRIKEQIQNVE